MKNKKLPNGTAIGYCQLCDDDTIHILVVLLCLIVAVVVLMSL